MSNFSVSRDVHARFKTAARERGISMRQLVEQALASPAAWTTNGVRSTAEVLSGISRPVRVGGVERHRALMNSDELAALAARRTTHETLTQRCSLDVSQGVLDLVDDRLARLRELEGVEMSRAELFDRVVNAALDGLGAS